jgi:chromosome partitioning protein
MKTIATINFKGGVGKTTVTWCLGDVLSTYSKAKVLLFDLDAQMSLTQAIALDADGNSSGDFAAWYHNCKRNDKTIFSALRKFLDADLISFGADNGFVFRLGQNYHFVPSTEQLYWLELEAPDPGKGKFFIKDMLGKIANSSTLPKYDYVLFDCPPSFTMLSYSVLTSCDLILIPFNPDFFAANGVRLLTVGLRHRIQPHPVPKFAVFANRARTYRKEPTKFAQAWISDVHDACHSVSKQIGIPVHVLNTWIPDRTAIRDAITNRRTPDELVTNFRGLWAETTKVLAT